jgi:hypothetical protein
MHPVQVILIVVVNIHLIIMLHVHHINVKKVIRSRERKEKKIILCFHIDCNCNGFSAPFTCSCGESAYNHTTLVETKEERERRGHPTGYATPYKAMGGLTGFSSLAEGYLRLDPSGRGTMKTSFL